jgi:Protein of unknown function (DUF2778)
VIYRQSTGQLFAGDVTAEPLGVGYSGSPAGKNDPALQNVKDVGPIPQGWYTIGIPYDDPESGPVTMRLTPDPENEMFGRDGFKLHGDTTPPGFASLGCPVLPREVRELIAASPDKRLQVIA